MKKYKIGITIKAANDESIINIGNLLQKAVDKVDQKDMIKLLEKAISNPDVVKTALFFIK